jgi:hypothetical protein
VNNEKFIRRNQSRRDTQSVIFLGGTLMPTTLKVKAANAAGIKVPYKKNAQN